MAEVYAEEHRISFSTNILPEKSKTKGIVFSKRDLGWSPAPLMLCNNPLPWVKSAKYLGNIISNIGDQLSQDVRAKRAAFIGRNCEILQDFYFAHPEVKTKINRVYNSSFPGSVLWDLTSPNVQQLINSWSVATRYMWDLPLDTHRYYIEELGGIHAQTMIFSRYVTFVQSLAKSDKLVIQFIFQKCKENVETVTGRNIRHVLNETNSENILKIKKSELKTKFKFYRIDDDNLWKVKLVKELTDLKQGSVYIENHENMLTRNDIEDIVNFVSSN